MPSAQSAPSTPSAPKLSLRERKKIQTRQAIRHAAYRLFLDQGFEATPVDQIAEAAEVSPSTVFRYFPTKEDIVLTDEYDPVMEEALRDRPADEPPLPAIRHAILDTLTALFHDASQEVAEESAQRIRLIFEVPALRARMAESTALTGQSVRRALAERTGRDENDLELRVFTGALMGGLTEALFHWAENGMRDDLLAVVERALDVLETDLEG